MKSHNHGPYFWRRVVNVVLCVVLLGANMMAVSAAAESMRDEPLVEEERQSTESVSPGADATEELLESSTVEEQIDAVLALLERTDELDEEGMLSLSEKAIAAKRAYERMTREEQSQIDADKIDKLLAFVETLNIQTLDASDSAVDGMKIVTAEIWAEGEKNQALSDGSSFTVDFSKQFTLHIEVESKLNLANKKVEITVPDGLTVVEYPIPVRGDMAESVTPASIDELRSENNYGGYHPTNGTITYSLKNTAEKNSFNIVLAPDTVLWNRSSAQVLKDPLKIRVYTDVQTYQTISATPKITGKYTPPPPSRPDQKPEGAGSRAIQTGPRLSRIGVKTGVPTAANQSFALRQIWINPDKDYIDMPQFFKKLEITIALPYYTKDGSNIYAELDHITFDPAGQSTRPNLLDPENHKDADGGYKDGFNFKKTQNDTDHTVTLTWENLYLEYGQDYFTPYFKWMSDCGVTTKDAVKWDSDSILNTGKTAPGCYEGKTPTTGAASAVGGTITWQDSSTWYLYNGDCTTFSFTAQAGESMSVNGKANNQPIYNNYTSDSGITYYLGQFHVVNQGGAASADKTVEFTYANNDKIGVTAQKIPATTGNTVEVWYTTTENSTEQKYNGTLTSSGGFVTFTTQMAGLGKGEYFTKIKADVGSYEKDYVGYVSSRDQDPTSGYATTFGNLLTPDADTYSKFASMKMYNTGSDENTATPVYYTVRVTSTKGEIPLAMEQAYKENSLDRLPILSNTSATAGDTITFNGLLSSSAYPYSSNNVTTDQEIYIRLPEKITVKNLKLYQEVGRIADKVFLSDAVVETVTNPQRTEIPETAYKFEEVTSAAANGYKLYKISFTNQDNPAKVGWFTDGLGQYQIGISFDMNIAKDADAMTLDMRDCVRFKSASLTSTSNNGTLAQYQVMDEGVRYSTFNANAKGTKLSVVAARLGLTFTFGARMTEKGSEAEFDATKYSNFENDGKKVYLKDANHVVDMLFTLKNETGREFTEADAQSFYYFIPVPKKGDLWDSHMQDQAFEFDMSLTRAPKLQGTSKDHILVTYATEIDSKAQAGEARHYTYTDKYQTEEELLTGCITDEAKAEKWKKVKMIRIAAKPNITSIPQNAELKVNMRLEPSFKDNADLVGSEINFGPCGVSPYSVGSTHNQGHNPLPRIQVEFQTGIIGGKIFIDKNFNGAYDEDTDVLYTGSVTVEANHSNGNENCSEGSDAHNTTTQNGTFKFTGRRADTYHVTVANPGSTDANGENPLKFSLPESGGKFSLDAGENTATASVVLDMNKTPNDIKDAGSLLIGFQKPHTVTFSVPNGQGGTTTKVWHRDKLGDVIPTVTADKGYRFTGNWTVGDKIYTANQLREVAISSDMTVKAEVKKLYSLSYDLNGGSGAEAPATSTHIEGEKVRPDYNGTGNLKKGEKTIFVGWSEEQITNPLPEDAAKEDIGKIISHDEHIMPAQDITLYAVYAVDANGNGKPDYNDDAVHVRHHGNNGDYKDIICPHHHVAGATANLSTNGTVSGKSLGHGDAASAAAAEVTSHTFTYKDATTGYDNIFIGWSTSPILDIVIKTRAEYDALASSIVTEVTMEKAKTDGGNADADGNTNVYAVWAADRNGNKTADYLEEYTLTYDSNAQQGGTVTSLPTDADIHIPGDEVTLSSAVPTHDDVDGKKVVFIGWTEAQTNAIFSRADTAPATVTEVTFGNANKTVYAAWGYDENNDGTADVLETYTLTYDLNGGNETAPAMVSGIAKNTEVTLTAEKNFTRNSNEIFVGWSATKHDAALTAETKQEDVEKFLIVPGAKYRIQTKDVTLYAVWAVDRNDNGMADYLEACATIDAVKILEGRDWLESDSFKFKLEAVTDGAPMPENSSVVVKSGTAKSGEGVPFNFGEITYTKPGTYTYEVSEVAGENKGMVYDPNKAIVTIKVVNNNGFNKLESINYDNGFKATTDVAMFANRYTASMTYGGADRVDVAMTLNGRAMHKDEFAFKIDGNDDESRLKLSSLDAEFSVTEDTAAGAKHVMQNKFQGLEFTQDDVGKTYAYTVKEDIPADKIPGVTYDSAVYTVKITPKDNGDGTMHAETVVTDSSGKTINPSAPDGKSVYEVSFVNTYKADSFIFDTAAGFNLNKVLKGRDWTESDGFEFKLEAVTDGAPMPENSSVVVKKDTAKSGEGVPFDFGEITYDRAGEYKYKVSEVVPADADKIPGVTYDTEPRIVTVKVTDNLDGTMTAARVDENGAQSADALVFTNVYKAGQSDEVPAGFSLTKVLTGRDWLESDSFEFKLTARDGAPMPKDDDGKTLDTVTVSGKGAGVGKKAGEKVTFDFGEITYTEPGTYTYEVSEVVPESDADRIPGMVYSGNKATVTVEVTDDTVKGKLVASATVANDTFTNAYESKLDYNALGGLRIVKKLKGRDISDKQFKFDVAADGAGKADTRATGAATMDVRTGVATSTIARALGNLVFTQADAGKTFNYTVTEQPGSDKGFTYDASKYEVSIGVSDDGRGVLTATTVIKKDGEEVGRYTYKTGDNPATGDNIPTVEFDNSFDAEGSVAIEATKTLKNRPLNADEFTFQVVDKNGAVVATATNDENGKVDFGPIKYTNAQLAEMVRDGLASIERKDGNLLYIVDCTVREVTDELQGSGVTPVLSSQAVTVEATDDGTPDLSVKIQGNPAIKFTNAYADGIEAPMDLNVKSDIKAADPLKGLELPKMAKGMFQFTLRGAEAEDGTPAPMPEGVEGGTKTVGNDEDGNVDFGTIKYTVENVWPEPAVADDVNGEEGIDGQAASGDERSRTFTYTVNEQTGGAAGIRYDDSVKTIKVTVRDDGQGNLTVTRSDFDSITTFVNTYDVDSVASIPEISVNKKIDGRDLNKGEFTFELLNKSNKVASTGTSDADGKVTFEAIEFSKPGTYEYTLHEAENKLGGVSYDSSFYKVTATVTQDVEAAQLDVAWTVRNLGDEAVENVVFSNAYKAEPTSIQFNGAKQLDGRDIVEGEFEFELVQDGRVIQTVKNAAADESGAAPVSFDAIEFTEPGEFDYEIREVKGSAEGVTYDDEVFTYHVVVTDNGKGNLEAEWTAGANGALVFVNAYEKPASPFDPVLPPDDGDDDDNGENNGNGGGDNGDDGSGDAGIDAGNGNGDGGSGDTGDGDKLPKTGDTSPIVPLTVVVVLAACVAAVAALRMRRN